MNIGLLIVGDEILSGKRADKHLPKVIELLAARGLRSPGRATSATTASASPPTLQATPSPAATSCSPAAASARRPTTTRASAPPRRSACRWRCIPRREALIRERMQDIAREQGMPYEPDRADNRAPPQHGRCSRRAPDHPEPVQQDPRLHVVGRGRCHFVPGFPVMAWPMIEWVLDTHYRAPARRGRRRTSSR